MIFFPEKCPNLHNTCPKNIFPDIFFVGGEGTCRRAPVSYAYEYIIGTLDEVTHTDTLYKQATANQSAMCNLCLLLVCEFVR